MSLSNVARRLTAAERAAEPRLLHVYAWFDGYGQAQGGKPWDYPRRITPSEAAEWRAGWAAGRREIRCHTAHGFAPCTPDAHDTPSTAPSSGRTTS